MRERERERERAAVISESERGKTERESSIKLAHSIVSVEKNSSNFWLR